MFEAVTAIVAIGFILGSLVRLLIMAFVALRLNRLFWSRTFRQQVREHEAYLRAVAVRRAKVDRQNALALEYRAKVAAGGPVFPRH